MIINYINTCTNQYVKYAALLTITIAVKKDLNHRS